MGHYITVRINAICKQSELEEIAEGLNSGKVKWVPSIHRVYPMMDREPLIEYSYKFTPTPFD